MVGRGFWTWANGISLLRLLMAGPVALAVTRGYDGMALTLFLVAALSDGLDGYVARVRGEESKWGEIIDPVADKVFGTVVLAALVVAGRLPLWMLVTLTGKELLLLIGGAILLRKDTDRRTKARWPGKVATVFLFAGFAAVIIAWMPFGYWLTLIGVVLSLAAGVDYARDTLGTGIQSG